MDVTVSGRNIELGDVLRSAAVEKVGRLDRFLDGMDRAEVHFLEERNPRIADKRDVCEVTMAGHGHHVRVKVAAATPADALEGAVNKLEHQLSKLKKKLRNHAHQRPIKAAAEEPDDRIVKAKSFVLEAMTPDDAVLQMDLLGHDFFIFTNVETGRTGVVYRRRSGDVGLIDEAP